MAVYYKLTQSGSSYYCSYRNTYAYGYSTGNHNQSDTVTGRIIYYTMELTDGKFTMPEDCSYMFTYTKSTSTGNIVNFDKIDGSAMTNMDYMFNYADLSKIDFSLIDTSNVTSMRYLFGTASGDFGDNGVMDLSSWDVSKVTDMRNVFSGFSVRSGLNLTGGDVSNVTKMDQMFSNCHVIGRVLVGDNVDGSKVTSATSDGMFNNASTIKEGTKDLTMKGVLDISRANTKAENYFYGDGYGYGEPCEVGVKESNVWHKAEVSG